MNKSILQSKTFYFGLLTAIAPLFPQVSEFMQEHTATISMIWGSAAVLLRIVTKEKIKLID